MGDGRGTGPRRKKGIKLNPEAYGYLIAPPDDTKHKSNGAW